MNDQDGLAAVPAVPARIGWTRGLLLATVTASGMLPATLLAVVVTVAKRGLGFTTAQAAALGSADLYGAALGTLVTALIGVPARWRGMTALAFLILALIDLASLSVQTVAPLLTLRFVRGLAGGLIMGAGYAAIGRSATPDRLFGLLLTVQFLIGGLGIALLPGLVLTQGPWLLFVLLGGEALLMIALLPLLSGLDELRGGPRRRYVLPRGRLLLALIALFLFEASHTSGSAFVLELTRTMGFGLGVVQLIGGLAALGGLAGALTAASTGTRWGRLKPIVIATAVGIASSPFVFFGSTFLFGLGALISSAAWAWSIPLVLGLCAEADGAAWSSFVAKIGLASGPLIGAMVIVGDRFWPIVPLSCILAIAAVVLFVRVSQPKARLAHS